MHGGERVPSVTPVCQERSNTRDYTLAPVALMIKLKPERHRASIGSAKLDRSISLHYAVYRLHLAF
jgi:hypothetical protein